MIKKMNFLLLITLMSFSVLHAQKEEEIAPEPTADEVVRKKDTEQHGKWKQGDYRFPGKPKNMWQIGLHGGYAQISGDVPSQFGWGAGFHVRKALGYSLSLRLDALYSNNYGLEYRARTTAPDPLDPNRAYDRIVNNLGYGSYYYNYKNEAINLSTDLLFNVGNLLFHKRRNKWSIHLGVGIGGTMFSTKWKYL
jgi:OmpA-OmpF porin, OOP family